MKGKTGDVVGRPSGGSSFLGDPGEIFFWGKAGTGIRKEKRATKGLWKLAPPMEIRKERGFPQRLEKEPRKRRSAFSQFPQARRRGETGNEFVPISERR